MAVPNYYGQSLGNITPPTVLFQFLHYARLSNLFGSIDEPVHEPPLEHCLRLLLQLLIYELRLAVVVVASQSQCDGYKFGGGESSNFKWQRHNKQAAGISQVVNRVVLTVEIIVD